MINLNKVVIYCALMLTLASVARGADSFTIMRPAGSTFEHIVHSPANNTLYIVDRNQGRVLGFDVATFSFSGQWSVGGNPRSVDISADGTTLYVGSSGTWGVVRIDLATGEKTNHPTPAKGPVTYMVAGDKDKVWYVKDFPSRSNDESIRFMDMATDTHSLLVGFSDENMIRSDDHGRVLFMDSGLTYIYDGDGTVLLNGVNTGLGTHANRMALNQDGTRWVTSFSTNTYTASINAAGDTVTQLQGPIAAGGVLDVEWVPNSSTKWYRSTTNSSAELEEFTTASSTPVRTFDLVAAPLQIESNTDGSLLFLRLTDRIIVFAPDGDSSTLPDISPAVPPVDFVPSIALDTSTNTYSHGVGYNSRMIYDRTRERLYLAGYQYPDIRVFDLDTRTFLSDIEAPVGLTLTNLDILPGGDDLVVGAYAAGPTNHAFRVNVDTGIVAWTASIGSVSPSYVIAGLERSYYHQNGSWGIYGVDHADGTAADMGAGTDRFHYYQRSWDYRFAYVTSSYSNGTNWVLDLSNASLLNEISLAAYGGGATANWDGSYGIVTPGPYLRDEDMILNQMYGASGYGVLTPPGTRWVSYKPSPSSNAGGIYDVASGVRIADFDGTPSLYNAINVTGNQLFMLNATDLKIIDLHDTPPTLEGPVTSVEVGVGQTLTLHFLGEDADGTMLDYLGFGLPDGAVFEKTGEDTATLTFTPTAPMAGESFDTTLFAVPIDGIANSLPYSLTIDVPATPSDTTGPSFVDAAHDGEDALLLTFDEPLGLGVVPGSVSISGPGAGSLSANPDTFQWSGAGNVYRAVWTGETFPAGGDLTVTVDSVIEDVVGNPIQPPLSIMIPDVDPPVVELISVSSNNPLSSSHASAGHVVTVSLEFNESTNPPTVTIAGETMAVSGGPSNWTATRTLTGSEPEGSAEVAVGTVTDLNLNPTNPPPGTTDSSTMTFDFTPPAVSVLINDNTQIGTIVGSRSIVETGSGIAWESLWIKPPGGAWTNAGASSAAWSASPATPGLYRIAVTATDNAGNEVPPPTGSDPGDDIVWFNPTENGLMPLDIPASAGSQTFYYPMEDDLDIVISLEDVTVPGTLSVQRFKTEPSLAGYESARLIHQWLSITADGGLVFANAEIVAEYDPALLGVLDESDIEHALRDDGSAVVELPATVDDVSKTISVETTSFSDWYFGSNDTTTPDWWMIEE